MMDPLATPGRIAFAGDWHANEKWARRAISFAVDGGADAIVHVGDFGYDFNMIYMAALSSSPIPILFVDGNHEDHVWLNRQPIGDNGLRQLSDRVWHLPRGFRWNWGGVLFLACGGAFSVDRRFRTLGRSWWRGEELTFEDVAECKRGGPVDVLIAHDCPAGVVIPTIDDRREPPSWIRSVDLASSAAHRQILREVVDTVEPWEIWHGHYHHHYARTVRFPYGEATVVGLDCDESRLTANVQFADLADLQIRANAAREPVAP